MGKRVYEQHKVLDVVFASIIFPEMGYLIYNYATNSELNTRFALYLSFAFCLQFICNYVFDVTGRWISSHLLLNKPFYDPLSHNKTLQKYLSQAYQLVIHIMSTTMEAILITKYNFFAGEETLYHLPEETGYTPLDIQLCFMFQICLWIVQAVYLIFIDARKKDYYELYLHHIATMALCYIANKRFWEYGLQVLCVHDVSDIFIDTLKILNLLHFEGPETWYILEIVFVLTTALWAYTRFYKFGGIIYHIIIDVAHRYNVTTVSDFISCDYFVSIAVVFLCTLLCLHIYWFVLLVKLGLRGLTSKQFHSVAKDGYEGVSDDDEDKNDNDSSPEDMMEKKKNN